MRIRTTVKHDLTFRVYECWNEEGGMGERSYGPVVDTLEEAVALLDLANVAEPGEWFIKCEVTRTVVAGDGKKEVKGE